jgi:hypothetical protein
MNRFLPRSLILLSLCLSLNLAACVSAPPPAAEMAALPNPVIDPSDGQLDPAIQTFLVASKGPKFSQYDYTRVDLDGDGRRDALVMFSGPHSYWCDMNGCSLSVFKATNNGFVPMSEMFPVRGPMYVSNNRTDGWRNLIVRVSGQSYADAKNVAMNYNGGTYPRNPFFQPSIQLSQMDLGQRIFP